MLYAPKPMHIPDGFLSVPVAVVMFLISIVVIAVALKRVSRDLDERQVPLMGVLAACIFAGQMLNFAVAGGTSGHLLGAALAAILLGPWAAVLVLTTVVGVQALIFQDGGLLALGANIFNMAVVGVFVAHFAYTSAQRLLGGHRWGVPVSGFVAGWLSVFVAALATALELALSGTSPANVAVLAMGGIHALIGIGEGLITAGALAVIAAARPDLLRQGRAQTAIGGRAVWVGGLILALGLAVASPLASAHPDGLEWVAEQNGFLDAAQAPVFKIVPDYLLPGVSNQALATILAGLIGVFIVAGVALAVAYTRRSRRSEAG
jgi:cobalt/nickel transport system permease protein